ncbi:TetR/AcrR family transcriptional regulator [Erwinia sp.]|uniref:acrylate utilization transcriptional regulator AcuR n=1 Tax=Erwinia citreus TaxID=558 RepID=UPI003C77593E
MQTIPPKRGRGRPPLDKARQENTRDLLIRAGVAAYTENSFSATGIEGVVRLAGVPKGSFYYYFDSKELFGLAVLDYYASYFASKLSKTLMDNALPPLERIQAFGESCCLSMARYDFKRGCIVGNLAQEVGMLSDPFRARLSGIFSDWQRMMQICLEEAKQQQAIRPQSDCQLLAEFFWTGWEGAVMRARLQANGAPLRLFITHFLAGLAC